MNFSLGKTAEHPSLNNVVYQDFMTSHLSIWDFALLLAKLLEQTGSALSYAWKTDLKTT